MQDNKRQDHANNRPVAYPASPVWPNGTKLFVTACLLLFFVALLLRFDALLLYLIVSVVLSYVIRPIVDTIDHFIRAPRWLITLFIYLLIFGSLISIPVSYLLPFVNQMLSYVSDFPVLLAESGGLLIERLQTPFLIFGNSYFIPIDNLVLQDLQQYLGEAVSLLGSSIGSLREVATNIATTSISFFTWLIFVLFVSFYITNAGDQLSDAIITLMPANYVADTKHLLHRMDIIWGAFLRGQIILMVVMGVLGFVVASALGLPNAGALGIAMGLLEVVPYAGPLLAAVPALVIAYFQHDSSWLGVVLSPLLFTFVVAIAYWLMQQIENYLLLPRIMGQQLQLHPVFVFVGVIAGWQLAGIFGIFLASPIIATMRLFLKYFYCKLTDQTEADLVIESVVELVSAESTQEAVSAESDPLPPPQPITDQD